MSTANPTPDPAPTAPLPPAEPTTATPVAAAPSAAPPPAAATAPAPKRSLDIGKWLPVVALIALVAGLFIEDDNVKLWDTSEAWSAFAIVCGVAQLASLARRSLSWSDERAWTIAAIGVGGLVLWWLLLVLPSISSNTAFAVTLAVAAAVGGLWLAPGKRDLFA